MYDRVSSGRAGGELEREESLDDIRRDDGSDVGTAGVLR